MSVCRRGVWISTMVEKPTYYFLVQNNGAIASWTTTGNSGTVGN